MLEFCRLSTAIFLMLCGALSLPAMLSDLVTGKQPAIDALRMLPSFTAPALLCGSLLWRGGKPRQFGAVLLMCYAAGFPLNSLEYNPNAAITAANFVFFAVSAFVSGWLLWRGWGFSRIAALLLMSFGASLTIAALGKASDNPPARVMLWLPVLGLGCLLWRASRRPDPDRDGHELSPVNTTGGNLAYTLPEQSDRGSLPPSGDMTARRRTVSVVKALAIGSLLVVTGSRGCQNHSTSRDITIAREWGRLAPLPASAAEVRTTHWSSFFSGQTLVRFRADPAEIDAFLAASPGLRGVKAEQFTLKHQYLPQPANPDWEDPGYFRHRYFHTHRYGAAWANPTIKHKGRLYEIPWDKIQEHGTVVIDDENHLVYIDTSYS